MSLDFPTAECVTLPIPWRWKDNVQSVIWTVVWYWSMLKFDAFLISQHAYVGNLEQCSLCDRHTTSSTFSGTKPLFMLHSWIAGFLMWTRNIYVTMVHPQASHQYRFPLCNSWQSIFIPGAPVTSETSSPADNLRWKVCALQLFSDSVILWVHLTQSKPNCILIAKHTCYCKD